MSYERTKYTIEAVKFTGTNKDEIIEFLNTHRPLSGGSRYIYETTFGGHLSVMIETRYGDHPPVYQNVFREGISKESFVVYDGYPFNEKKLLVVSEDVFKKYFYKKSSVRS